MQFSSIFVSFALASAVLADSESFGWLLIRSGSAYQYSTIANVNGQFKISSSDYVEGVITNDGKFKLADGSYAVVKADGIYSGSEGSSPFAITNGYLTYNGDGFSLTSDYTIYAGTAQVNPVGVRPTLNNGNVAPDFSPSVSSSSASNTTILSVTATSSSSAASTTSTHSVANQSDNGSGKFGVGAGVAAIAAALLI
jgi:hypothetical protein